MWMRYVDKGVRLDHLGRAEEIRINEGVGVETSPRRGGEHFSSARGCPLLKPPPCSITRVRITRIEEMTESRVSFDPMR